MILAFIHNTVRWFFCEKCGRPFVEGALTCGNYCHNENWPPKK